LRHVVPARKKRGEWKKIKRGRRKKITTGVGSKKKTRQTSPKPQKRKFLSKELRFLEKRALSQSNQPRNIICECDREGNSGGLEKEEDREFEQSPPRNRKGPEKQILGGGKRRGTRTIRRRL